MEVLNQNQRRSAIWRILALGILILAMLATVLYSWHNQYASQGSSELEALQEKFDKQTKKWKGVKKDLENKNNALKKELKDCRGDSKMSEALKKCQEDLKFTEKRLEYLEKDLDRCKSDLKVANSY